MKLSRRHLFVTVAAASVFVLGMLWGNTGGATAVGATESLWVPADDSNLSHVNPANTIDVAFRNGGIGIAAAAGLAIILIFWRPRTLEVKKTCLYLLLLFLVLPLSYVNFEAGDRLFDVRVQALLDLVLVLFGSTLLFGLSHIEVNEPILRVARAMIVFLMGLFCVLLPGAYFVLFALISFGAKIDTVGTGAVSAVSSAVSAWIAFANYKQQESSALPRPTSMS